MCSDRFYEKLCSVGVEVKTAILDLLNSHNIDSIEISTYVKEGYIPNYIFYDMDNNGYGIAYNLEYIKKDNKGVGYVFGLTTNDGDMYTENVLHDFNAVELVYLLTMLEELFKNTDENDVPIKKIGEYFDDWE